MRGNLIRPIIKQPEEPYPLNLWLLLLPAAAVIFSVVIIVHLFKLSEETTPQVASNAISSQKTLIKRFPHRNTPDSEADSELGEVNAHVLSLTFDLGNMFPKYLRSNFKPRLNPSGFTRLKNGDHELSTNQMLHIETLKKELTSLPSYRASALEKIKDRLGIVLPENEQIIVRIADMDEKYYKRFGIQKAQRITEEINGKDVIVVEIFSESIIQFPQVTQELVTHEMTHAVMRAIMGKEGFSKLPCWIKEGTAVLVADQGLAKLDKALAFTIPGNLRTCVNGLKGSHDMYDYAEDYLAFEYLLRTHGEEKLHKWLELIVCNKKDFRKGMEEVYKLKETDFYFNARKYALQSVESWEKNAGGVLEFTDAHVSFTRRSYEIAERFLISARDKCTSPALKSRIYYYLGKCYLKEGFYKEAIQCFSISKEDPDITASSLNARFHLNKTRLFWMLLGNNLSPQDLSSVENDLVDLINSHKYSKWANPSKLYLGILYYSTGNYEQAIKPLLTLDRFHTHPLTRKTTLLLLYLANKELKNEQAAQKYLALSGNKEKNEEEVRKLLSDYLEELAKD